MFDYEKLKRYRESQGLSLAKMRDRVLLKTGVSLSTETIRRWELGKAVPSYNAILALEAGLGLDDNFFAKNR